MDEQTLTAYKEGCTEVGALVLHYYKMNYYFHFQTTYRISNNETLSHN
jgi:hypothetical protein